MNKHVAVTGANGFVGRELCTELLNNGWHVRAIVRTKAAAASLPDSVESYLLPELNSIDTHPGALKGCSHIIHLAAKVHDMNCNDIAEFRRVNTMGTQKLVMAAINAGVKKFIYISTIKVNGERTESSPFTAADTASPQDPYAISKHEAECILRDLAESSDLDVTIIRPPLVYGSMVKGNLVTLMKWVSKGIFLPFGKIQNSRSLLNIKNFTDFIHCCLQSPMAAGETFLLSDGHDVSTSELITDIAHAMNKPTRLFWLPKPIIYILLFIIGKRSAYERLFNSLAIDISHTKAVMSWKPKYSYRDGINTMVNKFRI